MTDLPILRSASDLVRPLPGERAIRLVIAIPQIAIPKKITLPVVADPWKTHLTENDTWVYRFMLDTQQEVDAAIQLVYAPALKWERILAFGWGVPLTNHNSLGSVLSCLRKSYESQDYRAHCWTGRRVRLMEHEVGSIRYTIGRPGREVFDPHGRLMPDPAHAPIWLNPCRYMGGWYELTTYHPASIRAQMEASMVDKGCRWCPRLDHLDDWEQQMWGHPHQPQPATDPPPSHTIPYHPEVT